MSIAAWTAGVLVACGSGAGIQEATPRQGEPRRVDEAAPVREALAAAVLKAQVERDLKAALALLGPLRSRAARVPDARQRGELLVQIAVARAEVLGELGRREEALAATRELLPVGEALDPAGLAQLLEDPRLQALRARPREGVEEPAIEAAVREAVESAEAELVLEIGVRAAPVLEALVLETIEQLPDVDQDALALLVRVAERRGARFVLERFDAGGFFWKKRILRAMRENQVLINDGTWAGEEGQPQVLREPEWLSVLERLLGNALVRRDAVPLAAEVVRRDALSTQLAQGLVDALFSGDPDVERDIAATLDEAWGCVSAIPVLESALAHGDPFVRRIGAERLSGFPFNAALRAAAADPDPHVRLQVARSMREHERPASLPEGGNHDVEVRPAFRPGDEQILAKLLADTDPSVVQEALWGFLDEPSLAPPVPRLLELARSGPVEARQPLPQIESLGPQDLARLLEILAEDPALPVRRAVDERLERLCAKDPMPYLDAVRARLARLENDWNPLKSAVQISPLQYPALALETPEGARALFHEALRRKDDALVRTLFGYLSTKNARASLQGLDADDLELLFREAEHLGLLPALRVDMGKWSVLPVATLVEVLKDPSASRSTRTSAAALLAGRDEPQIDAALVAFLTEPSWARNPPDPAEREALLSLKHRGLSEGRTPSMMLAVIRSPDLQDSVLEAFLPDGTSSEVAPSVLMRMRKARKPLAPVFWWNELSLLQGPLDEPLVNLMVDLIADGALAEVAAESMGRLRHAAFVEPLGALLLGPDSDAKRAAVGALSAYLDDRTAELLLEGAARTSDEGVRAACFKGLESIRRYQDERARWAGRIRERAARERAVGEIVALLDDPSPEVRAQAARGLATLRAVEALPKLVARLKDEDGRVRSAVTEALEALNRPEPGESED